MAFVGRLGSLLEAIVRRGAIFVVLPCIGCVVHKQTQYFAAVDPDTGITNYYKLTVQGTSATGLMEYHLQAGYFSAASVDVLRGSMPDIPTLDMTIEHEAEFRRLVEIYYQELIQQAKRVAGPGDSEARFYVASGLVARGRVKLAELRTEERDLRSARANSAAAPDPSTLAEMDEQLTAAAARIEHQEHVVDKAIQLANQLEEQWHSDLANPADIQDPLPSNEVEERLKTLARLSWFGSLSDQDIVSLGMTESTDPYTFRKLVFWTTASNIDLNQLAGEIDAVIDNVVQIAGSYRQLAEQKKAAAKAQRRNMFGMIDMLPLDPAQKAMLRGFVGEGAATTTDSP